MADSIYIPDKMLGQITIWNNKKDRKATLKEINELIDTNTLFINTYMIGSDVGEVFVDLDYTQDAFTIKPSDT